MYLLINRNGISVSKNFRLGPPLIMSFPTLAMCPPTGDILNLVLCYCIFLYVTCYIYLCVIFISSMFIFILCHQYVSNNCNYVIYRGNTSIMYKLNCPRVLNVIPWNRFTDIYNVYPIAIRTVYLKDIDP